MFNLAPIGGFNYRFIALLILMIFGSDAFAQNVTFSGAVGRHELAATSVEVSGIVHIRFGRPSSDGPDSDILVPFTLLAGQVSVSYSKSVPWSLAGSNEEYGEHDYFSIQVSCTSNCAEGNLSEKIAHYDNAGRTVRGYSALAEHFGEGERAGGYTVNLTLLPSYGVISGQFSLPNGNRAERDIELFAVALDFGGVGYSNWVDGIQRKVRIKEGEKSVNFRFTIDESELTDRRVGSMAFGYVCRSQACVDHGLFEGGWLRSDMNSLSTNITDALRYDSARIDLAFTGDNTFSQVLPYAITLLPMQQASIVIPRVTLASADLSAIEGRVIVEKLESYFECNSGRSNQIEWDEGSHCGLDYFSTETVVITETPFFIPVGVKDATVVIGVEPMIQDLTSPSNYRLIEHQRIRFECDSGCNTQPYAKQGYFRGFGKRFAGPNVGSSYKFQQTSMFFEDRIVLSLHKLPVLVPSLYELLLQ